jgi:hypothetical protein
MTADARWRVWREREWDKRVSVPGGKRECWASKRVARPITKLDKGRDLAATWLRSTTVSKRQVPNGRDSRAPFTAHTRALVRARVSCGELRRDMFTSTPT